MTTQTKEREKKKNGLAGKALLLVLILLLTAGVSAGTAFLINKSASAPTPVKVENGLSAYEIAQAHGYGGSVDEWLDSLSGKSAYDIARESGYAGTEKEFSEALNASANQDPSPIKSASFTE